MGDIEYIKLLKNVSEEASNYINKIVSDPDVSSEIDEYSSNNSRFQLTLHLYDKYVLPKINISIDIVKSLLNKLSISFVVENNIDFSTYEGSIYEKGILLLLRKLEHEDIDSLHELSNNSTFLKFTLLSTRIGLFIVLSAENLDEQKRLVEYYKTNKISYLSSLSVMLLEEEIDSNLVNYLTNNMNIINSMSKVSLLDFFSSYNISLKRKKEVFENSNIQKNLGEYSVNTFCNLYTKYDDIILKLKDMNYRDKFKIIDILKHSKMSEEDFFKLFNNEEYREEIDSNIKALLEDTSLNLSILKDLLVNDRVLNNKEDISSLIIGLILDKSFTKEDRIELLSNDTIMKYFTKEMNENNNISLYRLSTEELVFIFNSKVFNENVKKDRMHILFANSKFPVELANNYFLDETNFYDIIDEPKEGNYKYDKLEYAKKMINKNKYLLRNFNYFLLRDDILDMGEDIVDIFSKDYISATKYIDNIRPKYGEVFKNFVIITFRSLYGKKINKPDYLGRIMNFFDRESNEIFSRKFLKFDFSNMTEEQYKILTSIAFRYNSELYIDIRNNYNSSTYRKFNPYLYVDVEINNNEDINTYEERRIKECDLLFKNYVINNDLYLAKNIFFNKYLNISIEEANSIIEMLGTSKDSIDNELARKYIDTILKVLSIHSIEVLDKTYEEYNDIITFEESIYIHQLIRNTLSIDINNSMFKTTDNEGSTRIPDKYTDYSVVENDINKTKKLPVYDAGLYFKMLVHSTDAYGKLVLVDNNYLVSWNDSQRTANHGICCSMISNDNLGMAKVKDVLLGFADWADWDPSSLLRVAPYDIYSVNDKLYIEEGRKVKWMGANDLINYTRHGHNELVLERMKTAEDSTEFTKMQPSYVVVYSDMPDKIKNKSYKCSYEMNIPIVYINKEQVVQNEHNRLEQYIGLFNNTEDIREKIKIFREILLIHENNRSGNQNNNPEYVRKYFNSDVILNILNQLVSRVKEISDEGNNNIYKELARDIIRVLNEESDKYNVIVEETERKNVPDIPFDDIIKDIVNYNRDISTDIGISNVIDLGIKTYRLEKWMNLIRLINIDYIEYCVKDIIDSNLLVGRKYDKEYYELSLLYSYIIGALAGNFYDEKLFNLLMLCTMYSKVGYIANYLYNDTTMIITRQNETLDKILEKYDEYIRKSIKAILELASLGNIHKYSNEIFDKYDIKDDDRDDYIAIVEILIDNDKLLRGCLEFEYKDEITELIEELKKIYENYDKIIFMEFDERTMEYAKR